jgi:hypothetical protein
LVVLDSPSNHSKSSFGTRKTAFPFVPETLRHCEHRHRPTPFTSPETENRTCPQRQLPVRLLVCDSLIESSTTWREFDARRERRTTDLALACGVRLKRFFEKILPQSQTAKGTRARFLRDRPGGSVQAQQTPRLVQGLVIRRASSSGIVWRPTRGLWSREFGRECLPSAARLDGDPHAPSCPRTELPSEFPACEIRSTSRSA